MHQHEERNLNVIFDSLCRPLQVVRVPTLYHEIWDNPEKEIKLSFFGQIDKAPVKCGPMVSISWAPSAECNEICAGFRNLILWRKTLKTSSKSKVTRNMLTMSSLSSISTRPIAWPGPPRSTPCCLRKRIHSCNLYIQRTSYNSQTWWWNKPWEAFAAPLQLWGSMEVSARCFPASPVGGSSPATRLSQGTPLPLLPALPPGQTSSLLLQVDAGQCSSQFSHYGAICQVDTCTNGNWCSLTNIRFLTLSRKKPSWPTLVTLKCVRLQKMKVPPRFRLKTNVVFQALAIYCIRNFSFVGAA